MTSNFTDDSDDGWGSGVSDTSMTDDSDDGWGGGGGSLSDVPLTPGMSSFDLGGDQDDSPTRLVEKCNSWKESEILEIIEGRLDSLHDRLSIYALDEEDAWLVLQSFGWDVSKIVDIVQSKDDAFRVLGEKAGFQLDTVKEKEGRKLIKESGGGDMAECPVCFDDIVPSSPSSGESALVMQKLRCGHGPYCSNCWRDHIHSCLAGQGHGVVKCMFPSCNMVAPKSLVFQMASDKDIKRYNQWCVRDFVNNVDDFKFCPNPKTCGFIVQNLDPYHLQFVSCRCGWEFCWQCGRFAHLPATCSQMEKWEELETSLAGTDTMKLLRSECRQCPKCKTGIYRTEGCNHLSCICGHEFCWLCRGPWSEHGGKTAVSGESHYYSCNRYESSGWSKNDANAQADAESVKKFLHFFNRYSTTLTDVNTHGPKTLKRMQELYEQASANIDAWKAEKGQTFDPHIFIEAAQAEIAGRKVLLNTYVLANFMENHPAKDFFEFSQAQLEGVTEDLALLNKQQISIAKLDYPEMKKRTQKAKQYATGMAQAIEKVVNATTTSSSSSSFAASSTTVPT